MGKRRIIVEIDIGTKKSFCICGQLKFIFGEGVQCWLADDCTATALLCVVWFSVKIKSQHDRFYYLQDYSTRTTFETTGLFYPPNVIQFESCIFQTKSCLMASLLVFQVALLFIVFLDSLTNLLQRIMAIAQETLAVISKFRGCSVSIQIYSKQLPKYSSETIESFNITTQYFRLPNLLQRPTQQQFKISMIFKKEGPFLCGWQHNKCFFSTNLVDCCLLDILGLISWNSSCYKLTFRMNNIIQVPLQMIRMIPLLLLLALVQSYVYRDCQCQNGGICTNSYFYTPCECPPLYVGRFCQTPAKRIQNNPYNNIGYLDLDFDFKHFVFLPDQGNYFKFTFNVCTISNPQDLQCMIFMTSDQSDGSPNYQPPIFSAAKIKAKQGSCFSFSSPYIEISKENPKAFRRIIIGVRTLQRDLKSYFYRTVTGKFLDKVPQEMLDSQPLARQNHIQRLYVNATYEQYRQTFSQTVVRKLIKVLIGIGILVAIFLFCRILLFSYGIDVKKLLLWAYRIGHFCRKLCCFKREQRNYRSYLKFKAGFQDEEQAKLAGRDECAICIQPFEMDDVIQQTVCRHVYHQSCLEEWELKKEICPLCRQKIIKIEGRWISKAGKVG